VNYGVICNAGLQGAVLFADDKRVSETTMSATPAVERLTSWWLEEQFIALSQARVLFVQQQLSADSFEPVWLWLGAASCIYMSIVQTPPAVLQGTAEITRTFGGVTARAVEGIQ